MNLILFTSIYSLPPKRIARHKISRNFIDHKYIFERKTTSIKSLELIKIHQSKKEKSQQVKQILTKTDNHKINLHGIKNFFGVNSTTYY